ncbi:hypothetical protein [Arthrobacter sp.]|uniref:hypothetical protein n=1 Tax=Arthrobacter sp. TaxID=1667 RepID=UPI003A94DBB8
MNAPSNGAHQAADAAWPSGPLVRPTAWELMVQAWPRQRLRRSTVRRHRSMIAELATQGWVDDAGRFGEQALDLVPAAAEATSRWHATGRHQGLTSEVLIYAGGQECILSVGPDAATLRSASGEHAPVQGAELPVAIRKLHATEIPTMLCAWAGVRPGTTPEGRTLELPVPVFTARAHGTAGAPPHEFGDAQALWRDDWFVWDVVTPTGAEHGFIGTAEHGHYAFGQVSSAAGPVIHLVPIRSGEIWRILEAAQGT